MKRWIAIAFLVLLPSIAFSQTFTVKLEEYPHALRNPMKGFRPLTDDAIYQQKKYATISHSYFKWNELENDESDTLEKIKDLCDLKWAGAEEKGIKIIPSIYLDFNEEQKYWPADMVAGDYTSPQFKQRLTRLIHRLGECWDNDPRVAWVETSIIGLWGEQHAPSPTPEIQRIMGDAFTAAFKNKKFLVRHPNEFTDYEVGYYWGSWAHGAQLDDDAHGAGIDRINRETGRWKTQPMEGEIAYNWGTEEETLGGSPDKTLTVPKYREVLIDSIRKLHCTGLGWVAKYTQGNPEVQVGAEKVQRAFGYRYVLKHFRCSKRVEVGEKLQLDFSVVNTGSAPFYAWWPVELSLLDPTDCSLVWRTVLEQVDIRDWLSGDDWDDANNVYREPAKTYVVSSAVKLPTTIKLGEYLVAIAIVDPAGYQPAVRFAVKNYLQGGRHPMGKIGVGLDIKGTHELDPALFTDPMSDDRLSYQRVSPSKQAGYVTIPSNFDDEPEPDNQWVVGINKTALEALSPNSWVAYKDYNFGKATNHFTVRAASANQGGQIELRLGSRTGQKIGSIDIPGTKGWGNFKSFSTPLAKPISDTHDLYLVFVDSHQTGEYLFNIESLKFDSHSQSGIPIK